MTEDVKKDDLVEVKVNYDYNYTNMFGINAINDIRYALGAPGRMFAQNTAYGNIWYGLVFMGVFGLILAGAALALGLTGTAPIDMALRRQGFFYPLYV